MNKLVSFRLCTLTDNELVSEVDSLTDKMYIEGGKVPSRHIPARPNSDYDLLVGELCVRFDKQREELDYWKRRCEAAENLASTKFKITGSDFDFLFNKWREIKNEQP